VDPCASYGGRQFVHSLFAKLMATYRGDGDAIKPFVV
jgi:hypothetical protein